MEIEVHMNILDCEPMPPEPMAMTDDAKVQATESIVLHTKYGLMKFLIRSVKIRNPLESDEVKQVFATIVVESTGKPLAAIAECEATK